MLHPTLLPTLPLLFTVSPTLSSVPHVPLPVSTMSNANDSSYLQGENELELQGKTTWAQPLKDKSGITVFSVILKSFRLMWINVLLACVYVHHVCSWCLQKSEEDTGSCSWNYRWPSQYVGAKNQTRVHYKCSHCSKPLSHLFTTPPAPKMPFLSAKVNFLKNVYNTMSWCMTEKMILYLYFLTKCFNSLEKTLCPHGNIG